MKRFATVALAALVAAVALLILFKTLHPAPPPAPGEAASQAATRGNVTSDNFRSPTNSPNPQVARASGSNTSPSAASATGSISLAAKAGERLADTNAALKLPPEILLQNVRRVVRQYGDMFGGNPVGTNPEITAALTGNNPKQINFLNGQPGMTVNGNGELVDAWGTPYFFHQLSATEMEIHSAGPDKTMWTSDDLITR